MHPYPVVSFRKPIKRPMARLHPTGALPSCAFYSKAVRRAVIDLNWAIVVTAIIFAASEASTVNGYTVPPHRQLTNNARTFQLHAGRGMGMNSASTTRPKSTKSRVQKTKSGGGGIGLGTREPSSASPSNKSNTPFDVKASLLRHEKRYEEIQRQASKALMAEGDNDEEDTADLCTSDFVVAVRGSPEWPESTIVDWVPVAQLCVARAYNGENDMGDGVDFLRDPLLQAAVSASCREIGQLAVLGTTVLAQIPRQHLQYAVETSSSFHKHVYEVIVEGKNDDDSNDQVMTKTEARVTLQLPPNEPDDRSAIKQAYRKLAFLYHPDRFANVDSISDEHGSARTVEGDILLTPDEAAGRYMKVKLAYETLLSGIREVVALDERHNLGEPRSEDSGKAPKKPLSSWYASLGGRERNDFVGPITLSNIAESAKLLEERNVQSAVVGIDVDIIRQFVIRSTKATVSSWSTPSTTKNKKRR
jgi:hypothetical protein